MVRRLVKWVFLPVIVADLGGQAHATESQAFGLYLSNLTGSGLSYHRQMESGWGYRMTGLGWAQGNVGYINVGGAITRGLDRRQWGQLYGLLGIGLAMDAFAGTAGLAPALGTQLNMASGLGASWGPLFVEAGFSVFHNPAGFGVGPAGGVGAAWWF